MKRGKHPTKKHRDERQKLKELYAQTREEAQLQGLIPTEPVGAVRGEGVSASTQSEQPLPGLIMEALRNNWAVPDKMKPKLVDELCDMIENAEVKPVSKVMAYSALVKADQIQYERDHPELYGKTGANVNVNNQVNMPITAEYIGELLRRVDEQRQCKVIDVQGDHGTDGRALES